MTLSDFGFGPIVVATITGTFGVVVTRINRAASPGVDTSGLGEQWRQLVDQMDEAALAFIRRVIQRHPDTADEVPTEIKDDLNLL